jgi:branched-chain amino acid transport system substrate-binding protein
VLTMKRSRVMVPMVAVLALVAAACGGSSDSTSSSGNGGGSAQEITLAAAVELTGAAGAIGQVWKKGIELAVEQANGSDGFTVAGKKYKWKVDMVDDKSLPDQGIAAYVKFVGDGDKFILGPGLSAAFLPSFNSLANHEALVMTPSSAALKATPKANQSLIITASNGKADTLKAFAGAAIKKYSPKAVAILLPQDAAGDNYRKIYTDTLKEAGIKVVYSESFPATTTDFNSYVTGIKASNPDLVVAGYIDAYYKPFITQAVDAGLTKPAYVGVPGTTPGSVPEALRSTIKNFSWPVTTRATDNADDPTMTEFRSLFKAKFGTEPPPESFQALGYYDPILALTQALQDAGSITDLPKITAAMKALTTWPHQVMKEKFDTHPGTATYPLQMGVLTEGKITYEDVS